MLRNLFLPLPQGSSRNSLINLHRLWCIFRLLTILFVNVFEGWDGFLSAFNRATSILGSCTRYQRGARRSMPEGDGRSPVDSLCRSATGSFCQSMFKRKGLGGWGCLAANSSWVMVLTVSHDATDSVNQFWTASIDRCSFGSIDRCSSLGVGRHQCELSKLIELSNSNSPY